MTDAARRSGQMRALLVDDSPGFRRELRVLLELEEILVVGEAANGWEAVELAEELEPDVILMDQNMPALSGVDATRQIKQRDPGRRIIFVAAEGEWREEAFRAGAEAYFVKDTDLGMLLDAIRDPLAGLRPQALPGGKIADRAHYPRLLLPALGACGAAMLAALALWPSISLPGLALLLGATFFVYGLKYYATNALILIATASVHGNGNGNGHQNGNGQGKLNGLRSGLHNGNGNGNGNGLKALGLTNGGNGNGDGLRDGNGNGRLKVQPFVSIHLPIYNEREVVDRLLTACTSLDYDNYEVVVADDSTDDTTTILRQRWASHPRIKISHRDDRTGFKGAALRQALTVTDPQAKFIVVFDADFLPPPDILHQFLAYFYGVNGNGNGNGHGNDHGNRQGNGDGNGNVQDDDLRLIDDRVAVVQGYQWHVLNASENWITRGIRSEFSGSYVVERSGQELLGAMKMISGSVFMIRAEVLRQHGWGTSITEDWELTLRLYLDGYKVLYTPFIQAPSECVATFKQLVRQRMRWAEGHTFNVKNYFWQILRSAKLNLPEKLEFLYYAPYYLQSVFFILGTGAWLASELLFKFELSFWTEVLGWALVFANASSLVMMNLTGLFLERGIRRNWTGIFSFALLTYLLTPYQAYAALKGLFEPHEGGWHRTQKTGVITEAIDRLSLKKRMRRLAPKKKPAFKRAPSRVAALSRWIPEPLRRAPYRRGLQLASALSGAILLLGILSRSVDVATAAPDVFYLHNATADSVPAWFDSDWTYRQRLTIDHTKVGGSADLSSFPVLINRTESEWADIGNGGGVEQSDGGDILFTAADGTTQLDHQIERYDNTSGELIAWVELPTLSYSSDTDIYIYYGNSAGVPDQWDVSGTWDEAGSQNFRGVWHLNEASGSALDSTTYGTNGSVSGTVTRQSSGAIGYAYNYGTNGEVNAGDPGDGHLDFGTNSFTVSLWLNVDQSTGDYQLPLSKGGWTTSPAGYSFETNQSADGFQFEISDGSSYLISPVASISFDTWYYVVGVVDRTSDRLRLYVDGSEEGSGTDISSAGSLSSSQDLQFAFDSYDLDGLLDEVRVAFSARTPGWIATEFNNQDSPSTFFKSLGGQETEGVSPAGKTMNTSVGSGASTLTFDTASQNAYWYSDLAYPATGDTTVVEAGDYTLNMYFDQLPGAWWNSAYPYRQQVTISTTSAGISAGYPVKLQFSHQALVGGGKSLVSGDDLRVVYWSGSNWIELDRLLDDQSAWNSTTTQIWLQAQAAIGTSSSDSNYYIYYGNGSAGAPPADWSDVFSFYDDFSDGSLDGGRWSCTLGTCSESGGTLTLSGDSRVIASSSYSLGTNTRWEARLQLGGDGSEAYFNYWGAADTDDFTGDWIMLWSDSANHWAEVFDGGLTNASVSVSSPTSYHAYAINREGSSSVRFFQDSTQLANLTSNVPTGNLRAFIWNDYSSASQVVDWVRVRPYVNPEPTTNAGAEQDKPRVDIVVTVSHTAPDGSNATAIVSSSTVSIDGNTANPYALSIGSGSQQTFTSADPRRLRAQITVSAVSGSGSFTLDYDSSADPSNLSTPALTVPDPTLILLAAAIFIPPLASLLIQRRRLAARVLIVGVSVALVLGILARDVEPAVAAPDVFYLHDSAKSGVTPAGKQMNLSQGIGGSTMVFDTVSQDAYWYSELSYPTGGDDGGIAAGDYTFNMYFDSLPAPATPQIDDVSSGTTTSSSVNISHDTAGTNRLMLVGVSYANYYSPPMLVSSISYNSDPLTYLGSINNTQSGGDDAWVEIWYRVGPDTGTHNVTVNFSSAPPDGAVVGVMTFTGVDQTTPLGSFAGNENDGSSASVTIPSAANDLAFAVFACETCTSVSFDSPATEQWDLNVSSTTYGAGGTDDGASPNVTISTTLGSSDHWAMGGVSIKPAGPGSVDITVYAHHTATDGSGATLITSASTTITSSSSNPLALDLGSGSTQTFTSGNPRLLRVWVEVTGVSNGGSFTLAYDSASDPTSLDTPVVTVPEWGGAFFLLAPLVPYLMSYVWKRRRRAAQMASVLLAAILALTTLAGTVEEASAAPDTHYLHPTATSGITPAGEYMNTTEGSGGSTKLFDTASQNAYWYVDATWPTGNDNATIAAGSYTFNMYFNQLPTWYSASWGCRKKITIDSSLVPGNLTDFPVLINLSSDSDLAAGARSDGYDILFTSADGTTKLSHEIELFTSSTGELAAWVEVPTVSSSADTVLFMYYCNSGASNQEDVANTWSNGFGAVLHLAESTGTQADSTGNGNTGTLNGTTTFVSGQQIDGSRDFDGSTGYISMANSSDINIGGPYTDREISLWFNADTASGRQVLFEEGAAVRGFMIYIDSGSLYVGGWNTTESGWSGTWHSTSISANTWYHVTLLLTGGTSTVQADKFKGYLNGSQFGSGNGSQVWNHSGDIRVARSGGNSLYHDGASSNANYFDGTLDELRISNATRSPDWIATAYNNQYDPSNFYSLGSEETDPAVNITVYVHHTKADGSDPQLIVSNSTTIDGSTSDPLAFSLGSASQQTFTSADPRRLRVQVSVTSIDDSGSFILDYDGTCASSRCSNLDTPVVVVPELGLAFLPAALLLPLLGGALHRRRELAMVEIDLAGGQGTAQVTPLRIANGGSVRVERFEASFGTHPAIPA